MVRFTDASRPVAGAVARYGRRFHATLGATPPTSHALTYGEIWQYVLAAVG